MLIAMMEVKLGVQKVKKMGRFNYLTVPKKILDVGIINEAEEYLVVLIPQSNEEKKKEEVSE